MKNKNLTGYLVDVLDDLSGPITISNTLDALYNVLNCDLIDITYLTLGEKVQISPERCEDFVSDGVSISV